MPPNHLFSKAHDYKADILSDNDPEPAVFVTVLVKCGHPP